MMWSGILSNSDRGTVCNDLDRLCLMGSRFIRVDLIEELRCCTWDMLEIGFLNFLLNFSVVDSKNCLSVCLFDCGKDGFVVDVSRSLPFDLGGLIGLIDLLD